jgi:hypothetical protein
LSDVSDVSLADHAWHRHFVGSSGHRADVSLVGPVAARNTC